MSEGPQATCAYAHLLHLAILEDGRILQVRLPAALCTPVGMAYRVPCHRPLAAYIAFI